MISRSSVKTCLCNSHDRWFLVVGAIALGIVAGCASPRTDSAFAKYDDAKEVEVIELKRTSQSWDGAQLPDYPVGKPELIVKRYIFPRGSKLGWHHHPVMNYGIVQQGELTIIGLNGEEKTVKTGEAVVEMVGTVHHGENRGDKTVVLDMYYVSQPGTPISVPHPEL
ncbi:MAG: cupin domain-containing protein [Kiritimatiellae bacterium]|nr:cupin domain-containing protein [Kiritimatiellia bacterium]